MLKKQFLFGFVSLFSLVILGILPKVTYAAELDAFCGSVDYFKDAAGNDAKDLGLQCFSKTGVAYYPYSECTDPSIAYTCCKEGTVCPTADTPGGDPDQPVLPPEGPKDPTSIECGDRNTNNQCGSRGGCLPGQACENFLGLGANCSVKNYCANRSGDVSAPYCGDTGTYNTISQESGCQAGYRCWRTHKPSFGAMSCVIDYSAACPPNLTCIDGCTAPNQCVNSKRCATEIIDGTNVLHPVDQACTECTQVGQCINNVTCIYYNGSLSPVGAACGVPLPPPIPGQPDPGGGTGGATEEDPEPTLNIFDGPTSADFKLLNPLAMFNSPYEDAFSSPAGIINRALRFAFPLAGLILFVMIVWGGFEIPSGATNSKGVQAGKQRITAALLGFGLLFVSFWIIQIVEYIFNLAIL